MSSARILPPEERVEEGLGSPLSRRTVVAAAAWSVPALSIASATPAFANASQVSNLTIAGPSSGVPASGAVPMTVTVKDAQGQPQAGQPVSFSGPDGSSFDAADGVTNGAGQYTANFSLNKPWATPGSTVSVSAVSANANATQSFAVLGANLIAWGSGVFGMSGLGTGDNTPTPSQVMKVFPSPVVQVAQGGNNFTLFRLDNGDVWGVGRNSQGQLADGTTTDRYWPPQRIPNLSNVVDIAAGYQTGYAVLTDGTVRSWGVNAFSALGNGNDYNTQSFSTSVVTVQGASGVVKAAGGSWFGLALRSDGTVIGWGRNGFGQLGDTTSTERTSAVQVVGVSGVTQIAATSVAGYALRTDGSIMAWGGNWKGQMGDGSTQSGNRYTAAPVVNISNAVKIAAAGQTGYALMADKTVMAWGDGENGELGNGASAASATPVAVQGLSNVAEVAAGFALKNDGTVWTWGMNDHGQIGNGYTGNPSNVPVQANLPAGIPVTSLGGSSSVDARFAIAGALTLNVDVVQTQVSAGSAGTVQAKVSTGSTGVAGATVSLTATGNAVLGSSLGQTNGSGEFQTTVTPDAWTMPGTQLQVRASTDAASSADSYIVLGANALGAGGDRRGALGVLYPGTDDGPASIPTPTQLTPVFASPIKQFASCGHSTLVLLQDGTVWGVGENGYQQVSGTAGVTSEWTQLPGIANAKQIALCDYSGVALLNDGTVMAWGYGGYGQLGDNSGYGAVWTTPRKLNELSGVKAIGAGMATVYALMDNETVRVCGWGELGQIGNGQTSDVFTFETVPNLSQVKALAVLGQGAYVLKADSSVWYWGVGGQTVPTQVVGLTGVKALGGNIALLTDGSVRTLSGVNASASVSGLSNVASVYGAGSSWWALSSDGTVKAWGSNSSGQLGDGTSTDRSTPVVVTNLAGRLVSSISTSVRNDRAFFVTSSTLVSVDVHDATVSAGLASSVEAKVAAGSVGVGGATVALSATGNAVLGASSGVTDSSGVFQTTVTPNTWTKPGTRLQVRASNESSSAVDLYTVLGANVLSWGDGGFTMTGSGSSSNVIVPSQVLRVFPSPVVQVTQGGYLFTLFLLADGTVWSVGRGGDGALGNGSANDVYGDPQKIPGLTNVTRVSSGYATNYALRQDGTVWSWGTNYAGALGVNQSYSALSQSNSPVRVSGITNAIDIAGGTYFGFALLSDNTVVAWGRNGDGQLGDTTTTERWAPVPVSGASNVAAIAATGGGGYGLRPDGSVLAWGANWNGELGDGSTTSGVRTSAAPVTGISTATKVVAGPGTGYALLADKTVVSWGYSGNGELGRGTTTNSPTPAVISGLSNVVDIGYSYALTSDGTIHAWGANDVGQLGNGTTGSFSDVPAAVTLPAGVPLSSLGTSAGNHTRFAITKV